MLTMSLSHWKEILPPCYCYALDEYFHDDSMELEASYVLDVIVRCQGSVSSGSEIRYLVKCVYGINLWEV